MPSCPSETVLLKINEEGKVKKTDPGRAMRSQAQVCGLSTAGIVGSNSAEGIDVRLLCLFWVV